jgi:hypothetical protein
MKFSDRLTACFSEITAPSRLKDGARYLLILGVTLIIAWQVHYAWILITTPYQAEYREGAILVLTDALMHRTNPFILGNHPLMNNNYGFLYNLVVLPFAVPFGNTLLVHRAISFVFIMLSSALVVWVLIKKETAIPFALAGGGLLMGCLLYSMTPLARPDSLGTFLFLAALIIPWYQKFNFPSLVISGVMSLSAFLAKPYFLLSIGIVAGYIFLFVSKKRGLIFGLAVFGFLALALLLMNKYLELYLLDIVFNNLSNSGLSVSHLQAQTILFIEIFLPCFMIIILKNQFFKEIHFDIVIFSKPNIHLDLTHLDRPFSNKMMDFFAFILFCTSAAVVLLLGKHVGASMIYFYQLVVAPLILVVFRGLDFSHSLSALIVPLVLVNLILVCFWILRPNSLSAFDRREWEELYQYVTTSNSILNSPVLVSEMIRLGKLPVDSGQTEYFYSTKPYPPTIFAPDFKKVTHQGQKYLRSIRIAVMHQQYDRIMITHNKALTLSNRRLISQYYVLIKIIGVSMPQTSQYWTVEVWEPK